MHYSENNININKYGNKYYDDDDDNIIQTEKTFVKQHTYSALNFSISGTAIIDRSMSEKMESIDSTNMMIINESATQIANQTNSVDDVLYLYGAPLLIFFCIISIAVNIKVLISVFWIRRPLSPTLYISLSLAGNIILLYLTIIFFSLICLT